jgi:hypothetical protein
MRVLLDRDIRPCGQHVPDNTLKVAEATKIILHCRHVVSSSLDKAFGRQGWPAATRRFTLSTNDPMIGWNRRN